MFYYLFGVHVIIGRLVSLLFSVGAMFFMYGLARRFLSKIPALSALALYAFSPMNIFFSRAFMPESSLMFFMAGSIYLFLRWLEKPSLPLYITALIFAALTCLVKPTGVLIFVPIFSAWFIKHGWRLFQKTEFWVYMLLAITPGVLWAIYANYFNAKHPCENLGFGSNWVQLITMRGFIDLWFSPRFYKFIGGSILLLLLTPIGFIGAVAGLFCAERKRYKILYAWLAGIVLYFYFLAGPNSGHIYYHLPLLPVAAIFFGLTVEKILERSESIKKKMRHRLFFCSGVASVVLLLGIYIIGYVKFFDYMYSNRMPYVLEISEMIKRNTPKDRFIIDNESSLLTVVISYYSDSKAQYFYLSKKAISDLENLRAQGATTFVTMETDYGGCVQVTKDNKEFWRYLNEKYKPIAITDHYLIFDLRIPKIQEVKK